jgi:hypothetical protein
MGQPWVTIIGRGHGGTRAMSHTLTASGVFMGHSLNESGDLLPPGDMYDACRVFARHVTWKGGMKWDFSKVLSMDVPVEFTGLIERYLKSVLESPAARAGWKIPETTLVFPWITRMYGDIKYIYWVRNPRDCILGGHMTDDLRDFGIDYQATDDVRRRRAISWQYQYELVRASPRPANWIEVRFEDFVLDQDRTLARLGEFLGLPLAKIPVRPETVGRYRDDKGANYFEFLEPAMRQYGYEIPTF